MLTNTPSTPIEDGLGRPLRDLRISVTDRCNFRCRYCMPREVFGPDFAFMPHDQLLTYEEIVRVTRLFVNLGVHKVRLTGGEPLLRKNLEDLVAMLVEIPGVDDIALTTNGSLLTYAKAKALKDAGLTRATVSLDSLDNDVFMAMNDVKFPVEKVLAAMDAADEAGLSPVKINMVVKRGMNENSVIPMAEKFRGTGRILRFIEFMDVGNSNGWKLDDVVTAQEILDKISAVYPLEPVPPRTKGEVATRFRYKDGQGEIGIIASVTRPFCGSCTRARLSSDGQLFTCLFGQKGADVRGWLRSDLSDDDVLEKLASIWRLRTDRYSEIRSEQTKNLPKVEMSRIGG